KVAQESEPRHKRIADTTENGDARSALATGTANVLGGTAWLWAREEFFESVDVLFVDEAGQMSLANVLAIAPRAQRLLMLVDPQQLEQQIQGLHPEGSAVSALEHVLGANDAGRGRIGAQRAQTIAPDRGLFLEETWRLPPEICRFTSEVFYED